VKGSQSGNGGSGPDVPVIPSEALRPAANAGTGKVGKRSNSNRSKNSRVACQRGVANRPCHRAHVGQERNGIGRIHGNTAIRRLQSENSIERGRDADRAGAIGA